MSFRLIAAASVIALSTAGAHAQVTGPVANTGAYGDASNFYFPVPSYERVPEYSPREREIERKYQETLRTRIPDKKPAGDPWRNMRAPTASVPDRHRPE